MSNDELWIFFEVQSRYKNICTLKSRDSGNFLADLHFVCIEIEVKIQTYVLWKIVINF
jgi:hypothetical protein